MSRKLSIFPAIDPAGVKSHGPFDAVMVMNPLMTGLRANMKSIVNRLWLGPLAMLLLLAPAAAAGELPAYCSEDPSLAAALSGMGPVLGLGSSVSHGLMARSISEVVAGQLCLEDTAKQHAFPIFLPFSYPRIIRHYYASMQPRLVLALDVTYHKMKILENTAAKKKELDHLVAALARDCSADFVDCPPDTTASRPIVILGDIFYENLIDCERQKPDKGYPRIDRADTQRQQQLCSRQYQLLNRHLEMLASKYPNVHLFSANRLFTEIEKYPHSVFYDEGDRQTFFSRRELTWDGWHPWTDPGSYVFANLVIMRINRLIGQGKINGRPIPLKKISAKYFGPPSGLIILAPPGFRPVEKPRITGPDGRDVPLRFKGSVQRSGNQRGFVFGSSYFRDRARAWKFLGPKPLMFRARSFSANTLVLSKRDQATLRQLYRQGGLLKGGLILIGPDPYPEQVPAADTVFLNRVEKNKNLLEEKFSPAAGNPISGIETAPPN